MHVAPRALMEQPPAELSALYLNTLPRAPLVLFFASTGLSGLVRQLNGPFFKPHQAVLAGTKHQPYQSYYGT